MGMFIDFRCSACGYAAHVSGRDDCGMSVETTTILCLICQELSDVVTADIKTGRTRRLRCPRDVAHDVRRWIAPDICPRCGGTVEAAPDGALTMWD